ncbi:MAG: phosphodiesterase [Rhizobiaceae bacterium]|nr:phosphodiesterase [Rhizobiaceae bacterium]
MKLVHISDIHIHPQQILGSDPIANFRACMAHVDEHNGDADMIIISGDLTHHGDPSSYARLKDMLDEWQFSPLLMMGNHDHRKHFQTAFPEVKSDENGYVQYVQDTTLGRFILLDTAEAGTHAGHFCTKRQDWLRGQLELARREGRPVYLVMHHNPVEVGIPNADAIGLMDGAAFCGILSDYRAEIRHIFFGHCHYVLSGSVGGIAFSAPRSTSHPCVPDFSGINRMGHGDLTPTYNVCLIEEDSTVVHSIDFLKEPSVVWIDAKPDGWIEDGTSKEDD